MALANAPRGHVPWADTLKGFGIALVVYSHLGHQSADCRLWQRFVFLFAMPLFFARSGYLHRPDIALRAFFRKKVVQLLVPYFTFVAIASAWRLVHLVRHGLTLRLLAHGCFVVLWGGSAMKGFYGVLWFLTCLFLTQQLANWIEVRFGRRGSLLAACGALPLSFLNFLVFPTFNLPWDAHVVAAAVPFFVAGFLCRGRRITGPGYAVAGWASLLLSFELLARYPGAAYDMREAYYGVPGVTFLLALGCCLGCVSVCVLLTRLAGVSAVLQSWGRVSMGIMFLHKELPGIPGYRQLESFSRVAAFLALMLISWSLALILQRLAWARVLIFGSKPDFERLVAPRLRTALLRWGAAQAEQAPEPGLGVLVRPEAF